MDWQEASRSAWRTVRQHYMDGHCVSERGLQSILASELRGVFPAAKIIVEPCWASKDCRQTPDIVVVEDGLLTDIFEIKFVPHHYAQFRPDIRKLISYVENHDPVPISIDPITGKWETSIAVSSTTRTHFVAISRSDSNAVYPLGIREEIKMKDQDLVAGLGRINLWYGRTAIVEPLDEDWGICFGL